MPCEAQGIEPIPVDLFHRSRPVGITGDAIGGRPVRQPTMLKLPRRQRRFDQSCRRRFAPVDAIARLSHSQRVAMSRSGLPAERISGESEATMAIGRRY